MLLSSTQINYSTSQDYNSSVALPSDPLNITAEGYLQSATSQNYFYLFIPNYFRDYYAEPRAGFSGVPSYMSVERVKSLQTGSYNYWIYGGGEGADYYEVEYYGVIVYKISINANNSTASRSASIQITSSYGEVEHYGDEGASIHQYTATFNIVQAGVEEHPDTPTDSNLYYYTALTQNTSISLSQMTQIQVYPLSLSDGYSYHSYDNSNVNTFRYLHLRTSTLGAANLTPVSSSSWARLRRAYSNSIGLDIYEVQVDQSSEQYARSTILEVQQNGQTVVSIYIIQYGTDSGDNPHIDPGISDDADESENKYWEGEGTNSPVSIIDTNGGAAVDSTSLLFKSNFANIYSTLEQKDNTLFLGNYISNQDINRVHELMDSFMGTDKILVKEGIRKNYIENVSSQDYSYIPNMKQNSQQKRIFKPGETYALGLVFVDKNGTWSSVYYLGDTFGKWRVSASLEPHLIENSGRQYYTKPVRFTILSQEITNALYSLGVVAVIPVYAVKQSNTIMCQGFLSSSMQSSTRLTGEAVDAQYSWFYRTRFKTSSPEYLPSGLEGGSESKEIQNLDATINSTENANSWMLNRQICTLNTPEVECSEYLSDAMLQNATCKSIWNYSGFTYNNNVIALVNGKYLKSYFSAAHAYEDASGNPIAVASIKNRRFISGYIWHGFRDNGFRQDDGQLLSESNKPENYFWFAVYPWQRSTIGGEGPTSTITNKLLFNSLYNSGLTINSSKVLNIPSILDATIYRDFDAASVIKVGTSVYQGNTDYIAVTEEANAYKAWTSSGRDVYPHTTSEIGAYAGYNSNGFITDPISIKYKTAPHVVIKFSDTVTFGETLSDNALFCVELSNPNITLKTDIQDLQGYQWIKCGDIKRIIPTEQTILFFEEGDYFFGRYDSLRTYQYAENDVNSVVEIVSGMLCSRVNLDSRCDRNRGAVTPTVNPTNFNIFNPVYNQLNNYFTFSFVNLDDLVYSRKYSNSIQWSLTKEYSSDVDNWCNIQDINTLDFDGDKGQIRSIERLGNELIVFQDTAISQIQYNEKTQIATEQGIPIEIGNSGKVDGKHYLYDHIGCQYRGSISKSPNGIYFIDSINKSLYQLGADAKITDLCTTGGMKSWGLANLDENWWSYYDINSQEILFSNNVESLAFSDAYGKFNAFVGYGGIRWNFRANDYTVQICPMNFKQVIASTSPTLSSSERVPAITAELGNASVTFWKKNSIEETKFFGNYSPIEIQLQCNPEPTKDKMFSVVEYRMDCFDELGNYLHDITFDNFRAWNEYQDTLPTSLKYLEGGEKGPIYSRTYSTKLRKKFRIWRLDIPRAFYGLTTYIDGNTAVVNNIAYTHEVEAHIDAHTYSSFSRDRIRNPWCNIYLSLDTSRTKKVVFNDLAIQYFK